MMKKEA
jgi:hypothetical protein